MSETIEKTFTVTSPARLNLSNIRGSVEIKAGQDGQIHVTAVKHENSGDASRTEVELSQEADGTVKVATHFPDGGWSWLIGSFPCRVDYVVEVPHQCSLKTNAVSSDTFAAGFEGEFSFTTVSGELTLRDLTGPVNAKTVSGALELANLAGEMHINTVSGQISGKQLNGKLHLDTVSGRVSCEESSLPSAEATTVSGDMSLQTALGSGPYRFNSVSGNVELKVPAESRCEAELHAISGSLSTKLPATSTTRQNGRQTLEVQGGGVKLYLNSVSGNLSLVS
ncbi:MAG TPA: DUF4097 family beta strand repeat-containing protein [Anaerolineales bacterium]|nr:DUF4097 family beta strand repeat-containing protein [Anaerolineales bacterium]